MAKEKEIRQYADLISVSPPEGLTAWLLSKGMLKSELLIYKADSYLDPYTDEKVQAVRLTCSECGQTGFAAKVHSNTCNPWYSTATFGFLDPEHNEITKAGDHILCPWCGTEVTVSHVSNMRNPHEECVFPLTISRFEDKLVLTGWCVGKRIDKFANTAFFTEPYETYIFEGKSVIRMAAYNKFMSQISFTHQWAQRKRFDDVWGESPVIYPWDRKLLAGSTAENSKLDLYLASKGEHYPVSYLAYWQKHPNIENLLMQGGGNLLAEMITEKQRQYTYEPPHRGTVKLPDIDTKQNRPAQMLRLNKNEFYFCRNMRWDLRDLRFYRQLRDEGVKIKLPEDMALFKNIGYCNAGDIGDYDKELIFKGLRYLQKQQKKYPDKKPQLTGRQLVDYWHMMATLEDPLNDPAVIWPPNLVSAHNRALERQKFKESEALMEKFAERLRILNKYAWHRNGIMIRPAASERELILEGKLLNHCVAGYASSHAEGKTAIFFIRRETDPNSPWYTLELDEKKLSIRQNRGKNNCARTPEITEFENAWLAWLQTGCPRKQESLMCLIDIDTRLKFEKEVNVA